MSERVVKVKIGLIVIDWTIYPRGEFGAHNATISEYATMLRAGKAPPPVILEEKSDRLIDGLHRVKSARVIYGDDYEIDAIYRRYKNDGEALRDACELNAYHGIPLDAHDIVHCYLLAQKHGLPPEQLALSIGRTMGDLMALVERKLARVGRGDNQEPVVLKRPVAHFAGHVLTRAQGAVNDKLTGTDQLKQIHDVYGMISEDMLNVDRVGMHNSVMELYEACGAWLLKHPKQKD